MITVICIMILAYWILGKDTSTLMRKMKSIDLRRKINNLYAKLQPYAIKVGRVAARPLLQFYYVLNDEQTSKLDRILIYAAIIYTVSPINVLPAAVYHLFGILDEGAAMLYVYKKIKDKITPEINSQMERTLNEWFGVEFEEVK